MFQLGYNQFWNFSIQGSAAVQELLNKKDLKLEDLLDEDGLTVEMKTLNQKLFDFLLEPTNFKKLISYAISEPDLSEFEFDQKRMYKYPFVCADVLSSDSQAIVSEFFKSKNDTKEDQEEKQNFEANDSDDEVNTDAELIEKEKPSNEEKENGIAEINGQYLDFLFSFLETKEINLTSAGYFAKIVNNLFAKRPSALIAYIYEKRPDILANMVKQIRSKSIAEFLAKLLTFESSILVGVDEAKCNNERNNTLKLVIEKLAPENDIEEINNAAYLICEVFGKYNSMHASTEILKNLLDRSTIDYFFSILKAGNSTSSCAVALILGNIFAYYILINTPKVMQPSEDSPTETPIQSVELSDEIPLVAALIDNLEHIVQYIGNTTGTQIKAQYGGEVIPFGSARLKLVELLIIAMKANNKKIYAKLIEVNFLETLLKLITKYEWNNMLHNQIEKVINLIIDGNSDELKEALFGKAALLATIIEATRETEFTMLNNKGRKIRKGYLGQITRISNKINESKDPIITKYTANSPLWKEYVESTLNETNEKNKVHLGGKDPRAPVIDEDEMRDVQLELPGFLQKFTKFFKIKNDQKDEDEEVEEEEHYDDDEERDQDQEEHNQDDDEENEKDKHIIRIGDRELTTEDLSTDNKSSPVKGRASFGHVNRYKNEEEAQEEDEDKENVMLKPTRIIEVEISLDSSAPQFYTNQFWTTNPSWFSVDDILKEAETF